MMLFEILNELICDAFTSQIHETVTRNDKYLANLPAYVSKGFY